MLGPGILFFGPPFSTAYALRACRGARAKLAAVAGLVIALIELSALIALMIYGVM